MPFRNITADIAANTFFVVLEYEPPHLPFLMKMQLCPGKCSMH
jgi:hypothetical protein